MGATVSHCEAAAEEEDVAEGQEGSEGVAEGGDDGADEEGEQDAGEGDEEEQKPKIELGTAPFDPRFPATNQAKHCYTRYNEYYKCVKEKGDPEDPECIKYKRWYKSLCPTEWIEAWEEQRENGTWPGKY